LVKKMALEVKNAWSTRLRGFDPEKIGEMLEKAIGCLNPEGGETWWLLGDAMKMCDEAMAAVRAVAPEKEGRQLKNAIEIGKRAASRLGLGLEDAEAVEAAAVGNRVGDRVGAGDRDRMLVLFVEVVGRLMLEVRKARLAARAEARKTEVGRVAQLVGQMMSGMGASEERVRAAENAVLDHNITPAKAQWFAPVEHFDRVARTSSLFYGPEILRERQSPDLFLWCKFLDEIAEDPDLIAEFEASAKSKSKSKKRRRGEEAAEAADEKEWERALAEGAKAAEARAALRRADNEKRAKEFQLRRDAEAAKAKAEAGEAEAKATAKAKADGLEALIGRWADRIVYTGRPRAV
jgi:hypothetical protein